MPLEIRGAHFNSECTISAGNTLRIGPAPTFQPWLCSCPACGQDSDTQTRDNTDAHHTGALAWRGRSHQTNEPGLLSVDAGI